MEELYLIEIFITKVVLFLEEDDNETNAEKDIIIRSSFKGGPQYIFHENQLANAGRSDTVRVRNEEPDIYKTYPRTGPLKWVRNFHVGKSILFQSFPNTLIQALEQYPMEFQLWTDEKDELPAELIGEGKVEFDSLFHPHITLNKVSCNIPEALSIRENVPIMNECCCMQIGELYCIVRLTPVGDCITTDFQQTVLSDPDRFLLKVDRINSVYACRRVEPEDEAFNFKNSIYEIATRDDPALRTKRKLVKVCTQLESCGMKVPEATYSCLSKDGKGEDPTDYTYKKEYPIDKIRMGDITGPCGNINCSLTHRIKTYLRNQGCYKSVTYTQNIAVRPPNKKTRVCGQCSCNNDAHHVEQVDILGVNPKCILCKGEAQKRETCEDRLLKLHGTGTTPISSKTDLLLNKAKVARKEK